MISPLSLETMSFWSENSLTVDAARWNGHLNHSDGVSSSLVILANLVREIYAHSISSVAGLRVITRIYDYDPPQNPADLEAKNTSWARRSCVLSVSDGISWEMMSEEILDHFTKFDGWMRLTEKKVSDKPRIKKVFALAKDVS